MHAVRQVVHGREVLGLDEHPTSAVQVLQDALPRWGDRVLLIDPALDRSVTYAEFAALVEGAALPAGRGERLAVLARNGLEAAVAIWACARAGVIHVGIPTDAPTGRVRDVLDLVGAAALVGQPDLLARHGDLGVPAYDAGLLLERSLLWDAARALPTADDTYCLIPTSGTTGRPKAVQVTGRMLGHAVAFYVHALGLTPRDRTAIHLPFSWVSGHVTQLGPVMASGGSAVTMAAYTAPLLIETAAAHRVTWLDVVPSIWEGLLRCDLTPLEDVRLAVYGGAPAPPGTLERVRAALPGIALHDVYALSETCAPVTHLADGEPSGSVGRPVPYAEVRTVGPDGRDAAVGEVWVRSAVVTPGYWGADPLQVTDDGWLRTGDLGRVVEGRLELVGRAVDLVLRGGVNVYPQEVERALLSVVGVVSAAACGVPSRVGGEAVAAAVVLRSAVLPAVLRRAVQDAVGVHAVPRPLRVVDALPLNANGKVDRAALRRLLGG